jgi:EAL domain-containing protein (putative c-di-GMP-specific phosphodiesterase class I)
MDALDQINAKLQALQTIGITIALDDFGTGYSSLNYLRNLNCDILKIDKTFIDDLTNDSANVDVIVSAIIGLSKELDFDIIAEGVEYMEQVQFLTEMKCDYFQGSYFSKPLSEELAIASVNKNQFKEKVIRS